MALTFRKVEGLGNDFLLVDRTGVPFERALAGLDELQARAPALCDRRTGVGADGILVVAAGPADEHGSMLVINHDGSRPEMCGNGLRCVAQHLAAAHGLETLTIHTDAGPKRCHVRPIDAGVEVDVDMGAGVDLGPREPAAGGTFHAVSMGNPHAIVFVDGDPAVACRERGPAIEVDPVFPDRTNVEFARIHNEGATLWVWERGVGVTQACGTGACATACAAVWSGLWDAGRPMAIDLPGGRLWITVPENRDAGVRMRGPATVVFDGTVP